MEEKLIHQSELFKLGLGLDERGIEYDLYKLRDGLSIGIPSFNSYASCQSGNYGHADGLLEVCGELAQNRTDSGYWDVDGWLTAKEILDRIDEKISEKKDEVNE